MTPDPDIIARNATQTRRGSDLYTQAMRDAWTIPGLVGTIQARLAQRMEVGDAARIADLLEAGADHRVREGAREFAGLDAQQAARKFAEDGSREPSSRPRENGQAAALLDITPAEYHALDRFSSSRARVLIERSPLHARNMRHEEPTEEQERGTLIHQLVLGKGSGFAALPFDEYRTKEAKAARDEARASGMVPVKEKHFEPAKATAAAIVKGLEERGVTLDGQSEAPIVWDEGGVACKALLDHLLIGGEYAPCVLDLKTTDNASAEAIARTAERFLYGVQVAAYIRAVEALRPSAAGRVDFLHAWCETSPPYAVHVTRPAGAFLELGRRRWDRAVRAWAECLRTGRFPGYGSGVGILMAPGWALSQEGIDSEGDA